MDVISVIIYLSIYLGLIATTFYILSFWSYKKKDVLKYSDDELPKVSVIIPAFNEEKSIAKTIHSILKSDYPDFEVIFVDDGSKDKTLELAKEIKDSRLRFYHKKNGGKASALNYGIARAKGKIVFTMDADTFVDEQSMKNMVRYFKDEKVMSVTPAMITHNPRTIWQRVQSVEYLIGLFLRKAFASVQAIYITPGAFSAYRKKFFDEHGGYDVGNITEDLEMSLRIQYHGYNIENCPEAPAYTIAPTTFKELMIQRRRWYFGLIRNTLKYRRMFSRKYGDLGLFVMPVAWISILFAVFVTVYLFVKTLFDVGSEFSFLSSINFDFLNFGKFNFYFLERIFFLFLTNEVLLFILLFVGLILVYLLYASRKVGRKPGLIINLTLFFALFALLFGFWWVVSIFYAMFSKNVKWK